MATAPRPGVGERAEAAKNAKRVLKIRLKDKTLTLAPGALSFAERAQVRMQTDGLPFEAYWDGQLKIGVDSVQVMWWLARRAHGEPDLLLRTVDETWPDDLTADDLDVVEWTPDDETPDDDPES